MAETRTQDHWVELCFPSPGPAYSINEIYSGRLSHWAARRDALLPWRQAVMAEWMQTPRARRSLVENQRCRVEVTLPFRNRRVRDPHNYYPVIKAMVDQLVHMHVWPDDSEEWVTVPEPKLQIGGSVTVRLVTE